MKSFGNVAAGDTKPVTRYRMPYWYCALIAISDIYVIAMNSSYGLDDYAFYCVC